MDHLSPDELQKRLHRTLSDLPPHRAPASLEGRVLAALAARAARPWWRRTYASWPLAARAIFLVGSAATAALVIIASVAGLRGAAPAMSVPVESALGWWSQLQAAGLVLTGLMSDWIPQVSTLWIYGGLAVLTAAYVTLFGLGAAAYRLLWRTR